MNIFIAGATGAVGRTLIPTLIADGHTVTGTTRSAAKADELRALGAAPAVMDGLDRESVMRAVTAAAPDAIVHQMTALSGDLDFRNIDRTFAVTNRLRTEGTEHLLAAAEVAGVGRFVAQSFAGWPVRRGPAARSRPRPTRSTPTRRAASARPMPRSGASRSSSPAPAASSSATAASTAPAPGSRPAATSSRWSASASSRSSATAAALVVRPHRGRRHGHGRGARARPRGRDLQHLRRRPGAAARVAAGPRRSRSAPARRATCPRGSRGSRRAPPRS